MNTKFKVNDEVIYEDKVGKVLHIDNDTAFVKFGKSYSVHHVNALTLHTKAYKDIHGILTSDSSFDYIISYICDNYIHNDDIPKVVPLPFAAFQSLVKNRVSLEEIYEVLVDDGYIKKPNSEYT